MKIMNYSFRRLALTVTVILPITIMTSGQTDLSSVGAEIKEGARLYREGKFAEAQRRFERALDLDPTHPKAPVFIARSIHAQFKPGVETPANDERAREAIEAYRKVLDRDPNNDDAYQAVVHLYGAIKEEAEQVKWLDRRASDANVPAQKRAEAYVFLASKKWDCSYKVTELRENRQTVVQEGKASVKYVMPREAGDFYSAQRCADEGLVLIEQAVSLNSESEAIWAYKTQLLKEKAKLADMQGQAQAKEMWMQQSDEAEKRATALSKSGPSAEQP